MGLLLVKRAQKGDADAFIELMERHKLSLYKVAKSYLRDEEDIADVMQDTILSAYEHLKELKHAAYFKTWVTRILINHCCSLLRQHKRLIPASLENTQEGNQDTYRSLGGKNISRPKNFKTAAAALAILCIALPAATYASTKTDFFQAMFGNSTKESNDVIHKEVDNGKGGQTAVTIPSKEYVPVDEAEAEESIGEWVMDEPIERKIGSHTLSVKNFVYDKNGALMYFTLEREGA